MLFPSWRKNRRRPLGCTLVSILLGSLLVTAPAAEAQKPRGTSSPGAKRVLNLDQCIAIAIKNNVEIKEREAGVLGARAQKSQADGARFPQIEGFAFLGPSPRARGDQIDSPDDQRKVILNGVFVRGLFTLIQPIFTFGEISNLREAAKSNIKVEEAKVDEKSTEVVKKVKEFYYGYLVSRDLMSLAQEVKAELEGAKEKVRSALKKDAPWADEMDLHKLEALSSTVETGLAQAQKSVRLAMGVLKFSMGLKQEEQIELAESHIEPDVARIEKLPFYQERSLTLRPEFQQIREGLKALEALVRVEESKYFPKLFVGAYADLAHATNRDRLDNPFVYDPLNGQTGGLALGFKWSFDFGITSGRIAQARAERLKVLHKKTFALQGIPLEVAKAYEELIEAGKNIKSTETSYIAAKKWLVASAANYDLGIGEAEEVFRALEQYAKARAENYKQVYAYNLGLANLEWASGLVLRAVYKHRK